MICVLLIIIIVVIVFFILQNNISEGISDDDPELFSTEKFKETNHIKSAKCPQCGKIANTYEDVKENFGLRKVGYATDIQSWCRECRKNKDELKEDNSMNDDLDLFDE